MLNRLNNTKTITLNTQTMISTLNAIKKTQGRFTMTIDYIEKTVYINGKDIIYTIKGF